MIRGEAGHRALFLLPALLFTIAMVIFPTFFGIYIAFTDWNLSAFEGQKFNGLENFYTLIHDAYFWNALLNMVYYVLGVLVQYVIAFGLALLLNADIRARKFFRVAFLLPFMLSPVAVSWMIGKSLMEFRFGPLATLMRHLGWDSPAEYHAVGCVGMAALHDDPAAGRTAGTAQGNSGSGKSGWRDALAIFLADHVSADAVGERHGHCVEDHFPAQTC